MFASLYVIMANINITKLMGEIEENNIKKAYLLLVEDQYLLTKFLVLLKKKLISEELLDFNFASFDLKNDKIDDLIYTANCFPVGSLRKLIIAKNIDSIKSDEEKRLIDLLKRAPNYASIVLISEKIKQEGKLLKFMEKEFTLCRILHPRFSELDVWIKKISECAGKKIGSNAIEFLKYYIGNDLLKIENEINKTATYISDDSEIITDEHLKETVEYQNNEKIFSLIDSIISGRVNHAALLLNETIKKGGSLLLILTLMSREIRKFIRAKMLLKMGLAQSEVCERVEVPTFKRKDFVHYLKGCNAMKLINLYKELLAIDRTAKTSSIDPFLLMERLVINLKREH